ncbi:MAG: insulinase family protein [Myxococcales bacterium]|nr:insulinase family protein [Myxococcales bacterium]
MSILRLAVALALLGAAPSLARTLPFAPQQSTLPNGLKVVTVKTDHAGLVMFYTVVRVGARDEVEAGRSGYAHFFEHMMFRGTPTVSPDEFSATLARHGADNNAYTTQDFTAYFTVGPKAALDDFMRLDADRFQHLAYDEASFKTEAGAVLGEYNKAYGSPQMKLYETLLATAFTTHTYRHSTIGFVDDIKAMPEGFDYARQFFQRFYTPDNCTVLVVGDVDHAEVLAKVQAAYGPWQGKRHASQIPAEPPQTEKRTAHVGWPSPTPAHLNVAWKVPAFTTANRDAAAVEVTAALLFGETSPLYQRLVIQEQRALGLSHTGSWHDADEHLLTVGIKHTNAADRDALVADVEAAVAALAKGPVDAERLAATRDHLRYGQLLGLQAVTDVGDLLAGFIGVTGDPEAAEAHLANIAAVTAEDVQRVARTFLTLERETVASVAHQPAEEAK